MIDENRCIFVVLYRSPSQNKDVFYSCYNNFELTLDRFVHNNPFLRVVIGDLNAKSECLYPLDKVTYEGHKVETIKSNIGLHQLIKKTMHIY